MFFQFGVGLTDNLGFLIRTLWAWSPSSYRISILFSEVVDSRNSTGHTEHCCRPGEFTAREVVSNLDSCTIARRSRSFRSPSAMCGRKKRQKINENKAMATISIWYLLNLLHSCAHWPKNKEDQSPIIHAKHPKLITTATRGLPPAIAEVRRGRAQESPGLQPRRGCG